MLFQKIKEILKKSIFKIAYLIVHGRFSLFLFSLLDFMKNERREIKQKEFFGKLQSCGAGVNIIGDFNITNPKLISLGNNVHIGKNAHFVTRGGLTIGDNTFIGDNVTIHTVYNNFNGSTLPYDDAEIPMPVFIGQNVWIGMNVSIKPGVSIGDGSVIDAFTVITEDVPPFAMVGSSPQKIKKYRDQTHYIRLQDKQKFSASNGKPLDHNYVKKFKKSINAHDIQPFFVVTTGRSGSTTIANILNSHPKIECYHERRRQLIRLSSEFAYGEKSFEQTENELKALYCNSGNTAEEFYGESDQKFWNFISILAELIPRSKFIWLVRDGRKVVASTYARGWYSDTQKEQGHPTFSGFERYFYYRLNAAKCGEISVEEWNSMSTFAKNCWYWGYLNHTIKQQLDKLPRDRWVLVKLEELQKSLNHIYGLLNVESYDLEVPKLNTAISIPKYNMQRNKLTGWQSWTPDQCNDFDKWGGPMMDYLYSAWREDKVEHLVPQDAQNKTIKHS